VGHNKVDRAQNRGKGGRLTTKNADQLQSGVDRLIAELGIKPNPPSEPVATDDGFGFFEVLAGFSLFSLVGLLNIYY
jgi:hypothetical protein